MIILEHISKSYISPKIGIQHVLQDVCLTIPSDKSVGILGRNGAGKSTLIRLLS
ncbi:MAG: ATP-binding cassette domain-containing protein, partial [Pseudomonadota bacterium]